MSFLRVDHKAPAWVGRQRQSAAAWAQLPSLALAFADAAVIAAGNLAAMFLRSNLSIFHDAKDLDELVAPWALLLTVVWLISLAVAGAYNPKMLGTGTWEYRRVANASVTTGAVIGMLAFLFNYPLSRGYFFLLFMLTPPALLLERLVLRRLLHRLRRSGRLQRRVLVAGDIDHLMDLTHVLEREKWLGYEVIGILPRRVLTEPVEYPVYGTPEDAVRALDASGASAVIFAEGSFPRAHMFNRMARELENHQASMIVVPALTDVSSERLTVRPVAGIPLVHVESPRAEHAGRWAKRAFDIVGSTLVIVLSSPLMLATWIAIKAEDRGPALFRQTRVGRKGEPFSCLKFRSMCVDAEQRLEQLRDLNESETGVLFKMAADPRITRVGRFIRRYSIDELPQIFNVFSGQMSLVGPRPALPSEVERYDAHVLRRLDVRPGMTGLWQVSGRSNLSWEDTVRLDLYYVDNWSTWQDLSILARTVGAVLGSRGAY